MSTNINITVGGNSLVDQAKAQQQAARQAQLEKENRARLEREAARERVLSLIDRGRNATGAPISGGLQRPATLRDEPAANKQALAGSFIVVANVNAAFDDNFELYIKKASEPETAFKKLIGISDFTIDFERTAYMYTWKVKNSILDKIKNQINSGSIPLISAFDLPWIFKPTFEQTDKLRLDFNENYTLFMKNVKQNFNGNFGQILYGNANKSGSKIKYGSAYWSGGDGVDITVDLDWSDSWPT